MSAKPLNDLKAAAKAKSEGVKSDGEAPARDYAETLFLPKTDFPMKAGLPELEPRLLKRWAKLGLYKRLRKAAKGREKFTLHDGPPYANGDIHIGHALNKILKDTVVRSQQMMGRDANYVPGWDCHGLPIEWKIEEKYRAAQKNKDDVPVVEFRRECRAFAEHWKGVQCEQFKRLGVEGDWDNPYTTMSYDAEAVIAGELMKFAQNGSLYRGSKPVMWSVVERTALAEAEVEYHEHTSPTVFVKFPVLSSSLPAGEGQGEGGQSKARSANPSPGAARPPLPVGEGASVVIWTTTPWTLPGNRAIAFSRKIKYGAYRVTEAPEDNWAKPGDVLLFADALAENAKKAARIDVWERIADINPAGLVCRHPLHESGYDFPVRLYEGDFITDDTGTGFVHIAPGHGADDYGLFIDNKRQFAADGIEDVPHTVQPDGHYFPHVPLFGGANPKRVVDDNGSFGKLDDMAYANAAVVQALKDAGALLAMGRLRHQYPHSWRSKAPVIFRNTPQWFIALDKPVKVKGVKPDRTIRELALAAIGDTAFYPEAGRNRITGMIENRPDWVVSRQRAWGVPITVFVHKETGEMLPGPTSVIASAKAPHPDPLPMGEGGAQRRVRGKDINAELVKRITDAFAAEGADAWFAEGARERFLGGLVDDPEHWEQVTDILDVWFDSGSTHAFVLEKRRDLGWPAALYLEGSDQHRGWFHSSLLEACGTRGRAPYNAVLTHGFILDEKGEEKMSKSKGNALSPQKVMETSGAEILRLWVASSDFENDIRFGPSILQAATDSYRKLRNTLRFLLGALAHFEADARVERGDMPELERWVLHRLVELDAQVRAAYAEFDFRRVFTVLFNFCTTDLSAIYLDIRKDAMYCEPYSSVKRRACLTVLDETFARLTAWLAPILCFTTEEAWLTRYPNEKGSVHLRTFPDTPDGWRDEALAGRWERFWAVRSVITGALEIERREKRIGSSLEAAPVIYVEDKKLAALAKTVDWAEIAITSTATLKTSKAPAEAFRLDSVRGVAIIPALAEGRKCARSWRITKDVGADPEFLDITPRDAAAVREWDARQARSS
jgi:isoleucyl-tRNA synthetase